MKRNEFEGIVILKNGIVFLQNLKGNRTFVKRYGLKREGCVK